MLKAWLCVAIVFFAMLACGEIGRRIGARRLAADADGLAKGAGAAEAAVFGLLGLLIAFTFSGAASRFEDRRHLVTEEANAIGTAYLRLDLLPVDAQPGLRRLFRRYTQVRASTYQDRGQSASARFLAGENQGAVGARLAEAAALQQAIWTRAIAALRRPGTPPAATVALVPALNAMIDITTTRVMATRNHPPVVIFMLLLGLGLVGALVVGYSTSANAKRDWFHPIVLATILSLTMYVIVDLEYPRLGLIQVDSDRLLVDLGNSMS
ncbi:MAG TPA: hypothetical protein VKM00_05765 [Luteimonas sp.]|nr:hypothetical protein [Luteimonas sp.]